MKYIRPSISGSNAFKDIVTNMNTDKTLRYEPEDEVTKGLSNFIGERHSRQLSILPTFGGHSHCGIGDIMDLVSYTIPQEIVIKGHMTL